MRRVGHAAPLRLPPLTAGPISEGHLAPGPGRQGPLLWLPCPPTHAPELASITESRQHKWETFHSTCNKGCTSPVHVHRWSPPEVNDLQFPPTAGACRCQHTLPCPPSALQGGASLQCVLCFMLKHCCSSNRWTFTHILAGPFMSNRSYHFLILIEIYSAGSLSADLLGGCILHCPWPAAADRGHQNFQTKRPAHLEACSVETFRPLI
mmetsp:Transcript_140654/g.244945  ORF Transcript_140654/g.244945 Transcript_140654/m.244945 type:complete len:208 (-) Transcript_140654:229-852(-)